MVRLKPQKVMSLILTLIVIGSIILSGPAQAITLGIEDLPSSVTEGDEIEFQAKVDIHSNDFLLADTHLTVNISGNGRTYTCTFDLDGTNLSSCDRFSVVLNSSNLGSYQQSFGYGYGFNGSRTGGFNLSASPAYGYAYNFGYGANDYSSLLGSIPELIYNITWRSVSVDADQVMTVSLEASMTDGSNEVVFRTLTDNARQFTLSNSVSNSGGGGGSNFYNQDVFDQDETQEDTLEQEANRLMTPSTIDQETVDELIVEGEAHMLVEEKQFVLNQEQDLLFTEKSGSMNGQQHRAKFKEIHFSMDSSERYVIIEVSSDPQDVKIFEGQTVAVDTDQNGKFDLLITVSEIAQDSAKAIFQELSERAGTVLTQEAQNPPKEEVNRITGDTVAEVINDAILDNDSDDGAENDSSNPIKWPLILIIIGVLIVGVLGIFLLFMKKPHRPRYRYEE